MIGSTFPISTAGMALDRMGYMFWRRRPVAWHL